MVTSDDASTCSVCNEIIFRTNMDGKWHHPYSHPDHAATPQDK